MNPVATVIIPTYNHGRTLTLALQTALAQTVRVEIFLIGDGVPDATRKIINDLMTADDRIQFFDHPKHISRGEPYRDQALRKARGRIVCYLCDRDLWLPDHVERMADLLEDADFAHSLSLHVMPGGIYRFFPVDLALMEHRQRMLKLYNHVAFSCAAHTLDMYRRLDTGWDTTPQGKQTDWHMFQKFLAHPDCRCVSSTYPSAITFPSPPRLSWGEKERIEELELWAARLATDRSRLVLVEEILEAAVRARDRDLAEVYERVENVQRVLRDLRGSRLWQIRNALVRLNVFRKVARLLKS